MSSASQGLQSCLNPITQKPESSFWWSELIPLKNTSNAFTQFTNKPDQLYVDPFAKRSTFQLSLEMCTETIGNETGTYIDPTLDEYSYLLTEKQSSSTKLEKKIKHSTNFPPPLSSISGNYGVRVQAHREGGRLKIMAFGFCSSRTNFKVERGNGRLRLYLAKDEYVHHKDGGARFSSRCNGTRKLPSLPVCVAIS